MDGKDDVKMYLGETAPDGSESLLCRMVLYVLAVINETV